MPIWVYSTPPSPQYTYTGTYTKQNQTREVVGSLGVSKERSRFRDLRGPGLTVPICTHWPLEREGVSSPDAGQKALLSMKTWPSEMATRGHQHPSCELGEGWGVFPRA